MKDWSICHVLSVLCGMFVLTFFTFALYSSVVDAGVAQVEQRQAECYCRCKPHLGRYDIATGRCLCEIDLFK